MHAPPRVASCLPTHLFGSAQEARYAYDLGIIKLQQRIKVRVPYAKPKTTLIPQAAGILGSGSTDGGSVLALEGNVKHMDETPVSTTATEIVPRFEVGSSAAGRGRTAVIETTVGRIIFDEILPGGLGAAVTGGIDFINCKMDRQILKTVVARSHEVLGNEGTAEVVDSIKRIGFEYATQSGITIAVNDLRVPAEKTGPEGTFYIDLPLDEPLFAPTPQGAGLIETPTMAQPVEFGTPVHAMVVVPAPAFVLPAPRIWSQQLTDD